MAQRGVVGGDGTGDSEGYGQLSYTPEDAVVVQGSGRAVLSLSNEGGAGRHEIGLREGMFVGCGKGEG